MPQVAVVTDSTAYLPPDLATGVTVVPLHVVLGRRTGLEGVQVSPGDVALALHERRISVTTSRPTPAELAAAYRATGSTSIVSVHLSSLLSGTHEAATVAAREVAAEGIAVRVVDSRTLAMGLGFAVVAAAACAAEGRSLDAVYDTAVASAARSSLFVVVETLEHLRRGGRIGAASALVGTALAVKPVLEVRDGSLVPLEKVRTSARALLRLSALASAAAGDEAVDVAVHHLEAPSRAADLADALAHLPGLRSMRVLEVGAVVGAHVGPGLVGVVVSRRLEGGGATAVPAGSAS